VKKFIIILVIFIAFKANCQSEGIPDKLKSVVMYLAAPRWGDNKNENNSYLNVEVSIKTDNKQAIVSILELRDNTEIKRGYWVRHVMMLPGNYKNITYENVESIDATVTYWKPDAGKGDITGQDVAVTYESDKWNARAEVVLLFESGKILSTNGSDPAQELNFGKGRKTYTPFLSKDRQPVIITRKMMFDYIGFERVPQGSVN